MLALYRSGRQADALAAYRDARAALDELGLEPSAELRAPRAADPPPGSGARPALAASDPAGAARAPARHDAARRPRARDRSPDQPPGAPGDPARDAHRPRRDGEDAAGARGGAQNAAEARRRLRRPLGRSRSGPRRPHGGAHPRRERVPGRGPGRDGGRDARRAPDRCSSSTTSSRCSTRRSTSARLLDAATDASRDRDEPRTTPHHARAGSTRCSRCRCPTSAPTRLGASSDVAAVRLYVERVHAVRSALRDHATRTQVRSRASVGLSTGFPSRSSSLRPGCGRSGRKGRPHRLGERLSLLVARRARPPRAPALAPRDARLERPAARGRRRCGSSALSVHSAAERRSMRWRPSLRGSDVPSALEDLLDAALVTRTTGVNGRAPVRHARDRPGVRGGAPRRRRERSARSAIVISVGSSPWSRARGCTGSGTRTREWLDRIELEHDNYRAALDHAIATGDAHRELRARKRPPVLLAGARLRRRGPTPARGGRGARRTPSSPKLRGAHARRSGDHGVHRRRLRARHELWSRRCPLIEAVGEPREIARAHFELGAWAHAQGATAGARQLYETAREALTEVDDPVGQATVLGNLAIVYQATGEPALAREASEARARAVRAERRPGRARGDDAQHGVRRAREQRLTGGRAPPRGGARVGGAPRRTGR